MTDAAAFYVYAYFRLDGTPCYVGKGKGERWRHRGKYGRNKHFLRIRAQAKALGRDLPCEKLIDGVTDQEAMQIERDLILLVGRTANGGPLVNLTDGGDGASGSRRTPEQIEAMSAIRRGRKLTPEWREAIRAGLKGKPKSLEHAAAVGAAHLGKKRASGWWSTEEGRAKQRANNSGHTGHQHSEATRQAIRHRRTQQTARNAVILSPTWAKQNSVRYPHSVAA